MRAPVGVFISYAPDDELHARELEKHLAVLERDGDVRLWHQGRGRAGAEPRREASEHLGAAAIVVLLVSASYNASDYLHEHELCPALARVRDGALVMPVIVRRHDLEHAPYAHLTLLPRNEVPVAEWPRHDDAWAEVAAEIRAAVEARSGGSTARPTARHAGAPSAVYEGPGGVPATAVPHFLGRDDEMRELRAALAEEHAVCVVATGLGGVGKTSLVRQLVATEAPAMFPDGSVWIDAMSLDGDAARVCERFGFRGERRATPAEAAQFLARVLHDKRVLVVVDNVWPDKVEVTALPIVGGSSRTVLTSRVVTLHTALDKPARRLKLGAWSKDACRIYLVAMAEARAEADAGALDALAAFVDHLPLGVKLVARLLARPGTTPARLLARLKEEPLGVLDKVAVGADRGVAATFKASYDELDDAQRRVVLALAACARVTDAGMVGRLAAPIWGIADDTPASARSTLVAVIAGVDPAQVGEVLADLAERSLVECVDGERGLWTLHDVVRLFVRAQPGMRDADEAHLAFARQHVEAHQDPRDWRAMEAGMAEVLAAVDRLLAEGEASGAADLVIRAHVHLMERGRYAELIERYERLAARLPEGSEALAIVLGNVAICHRTLGDFPKAIEHHRRALVIDEALGRRERQAIDLGNVAICYRRLGDLSEAIEHSQHALALNEALGRLEGKAVDLENLGICYREQVQGDLPKAIEHHERALAIEEQLGRLAGQAANLDALGLCHRKQGDLPKAIEHHERALAINEKLGRLEGQAISLHNLGLCHHDRADRVRALDHYRRSLDLKRRIGFPDHHPKIKKTLDAIASLAAAAS